MASDVAQIREAISQRKAPSSDFDLNARPVLAPTRALTPAAVLVGIWERPNGLQLILTKRASHLLHHPGQIALPGGKIAPTDTGVEAAALREAMEEIALQPISVEILGQLSVHETVTGFEITPVVGLIKGDFDPVPETREVEEVFVVPLHHVLNQAHYRIEHRLWRGELRSYYTVPYGPYYIWGATARILRGFAESLSR